MCVCLSTVVFLLWVCYHGCMSDTNLDDRESDFNIAQSSEKVVFRPNHAFWRTRPRERDLKPQLIYFYRNIGYEPPVVVIYNEQEAAFMEKSSWRYMLKPIGCSDGAAYQKVIRNCGIKPGAVIPREQATDILNDALAAEIAVAKQNGYTSPQDQNVHFDNSFPVDQRPTFVPPK